MSLAQALSTALSGLQVAQAGLSVTAANVANANQLTDAWFVGYAPVGAAGGPHIVAGALFPNQGAGGATAAPAVRQVLVTGLQAHQ